MLLWVVEGVQELHYIYIYIYIALIESAVTLTFYIALQDYNVTVS